MSADSTTATGTLSITSPRFTDHGPIPTQYTCEGKDISPPLEWHGAPSGTKSFVLIVDDPDAPDPKKPQRIWVHWVLYNIPATVHELAEGADPDTLPVGTREGVNDWQNAAYGGPCPPIGRHRYFFKLYALDTMLPDLGQPTKGAVEEAMHGNIIAQAQVMGTYEKQ
ncbi:MAG TPA: YbhB/YbcL family Raf kinase inhibitor-like protein [Gemmatimonadaceae bacterium]|nr:YbhB/YbcL family Raf kinase inhibitor-like protein [Gemmatimonadaceae bacterium]